LCGGEKGNKNFDFLPISNDTKVARNSSEYTCAAVAFKIENKTAKNLQLIEVKCSDKFPFFCEWDR
jgi:hypothetical protein